MSPEHARHIIRYVTLERVGEAAAGSRGMRQIIVADWRAVKAMDEDTRELYLAKALISDADFAVSGTSPFVLAPRWSF